MFHTLLSELSQAVVDAGAVPLLVLCIQEPEMPLKRIAASALSDICKHSPEVSYAKSLYFSLYNFPLMSKLFDVFLKAYHLRAGTTRNMVDP